MSKSDDELAKRNKEGAVNLIYKLLYEMLEDGSIYMSRTEKPGEFLKRNILNNMVVKGFAQVEMLRAPDFGKRYTLSPAGRHALVIDPFIPLYDQRAMDNENTVIASRVQCCHCEAIIKVHANVSISKTACEDCKG